VAQAHDVAWTTTLRQDGLNGVLDAAIAEIAQEGIPGAQGQKTQLRRLAGRSFGKKSIHDFVRCAVTADGDEVANSTTISSACDLGGLLGGICLGYLNLNSTGFQAIQSRP
jgi:hypothetical protein